MTVPLKIVRIMSKDSSSNVIIFGMAKGLIRKLIGITHRSPLPIAKMCHGHRIQMVYIKKPEIHSI
ncbi:hypothetical protein KIN20_038000 [Parelaphostrongylus tenuis]|uniref:Uncharacterized protein n=1 Tax=Parelaphostrongylus tenuis TaxID=148309 RepID=A0AAD5RET7_PARTN|nr:hypothetical protein KIN20_038000 [Parelaphostrongylus tenuis]